MSTITISKKEYRDLVDKRLRYEYLRQILEKDIFSPPPTRDVRKIIKVFDASGKYNAEFLRGLEKGLRRSSHFRS